MKEFWKSWKFWTLFGIIVALVIAAVVLHLVQPKVTYSFLEIVAFVTFVLGCVAGVIFQMKWIER